MPHGTVAIDGSNAKLIPCARSDGFGAVVELATEFNASPIPTTVIIKDMTAKLSDAIPDQISHRFARDFGADKFGMSDASGFSTIVRCVLIRTNNAG